MMVSLSNRLTNLIYVLPERITAEKYQILLNLIKCARDHRCINAASVGINQVRRSLLFIHSFELILHIPIRTLGQKMDQRLESLNRTSSRTLSNYARSLHSCR